MAGGSLGRKNDVQYALAACFQCLVDNFFRCYIFAEDSLFIFRHLGYFKILAVKTTEVTANCCNGIGMASGLEVKERLFFYRVYVVGDNLAIDKCIERAAPVFSDTADASFAIGNLAMMRAQKAMNKIFFSFTI